MKIIDAHSWKAATREFAIVVAGVLCALAAQAWWQGHEDRGRERDYLRQLYADTQENLRRIDFAIRDDSAAGVAVGHLASTLFGTLPLPPANTVRDLFGGPAFASSDFQPLSGTYNALLMVGDIRLIRTDSLRALLVAYTAGLAHEQEMLRFFLNQAAGDPAQLAHSMPFLGGLMFRDDERIAAANFEKLRHDDDAKAAFFALQVSNVNRVTHLRRLRDETQRLNQALASESAVSSREK